MDRKKTLVLVPALIIVAGLINLLNTNVSRNSKILWIILMTVAIGLIVVRIIKSKK